MKYSLIYLTILTALLFSGCTGNETGHSHEGMGAHDHSHSDSPAHTESATSHDSESADHTDAEHNHEAVTEGQHAHSEGTSSVSAHSDTESTQREGSGAVTMWTSKTELFMEYPELIVGQSATFIVHLTRLSDFQPIAKSEVQFHLKSDHGIQLDVIETEVRVPGIYEPEFEFQAPGRYDMTITIQGMVQDTMQVDGIPVYAAADEIPETTVAEDPNLVTFLKEQQWDIPFGTTSVISRNVTQTIRVPGEIVAATPKQAAVSAPFAGILLPSMNTSLPVEGQDVAQGTTLAILSPAIQSENGENYVQQFITAQSELQLAKMDLERSRKLYEKEAIPESEFQRSRLDYRQALTRFEIINELLQIDTSDTASDENFTPSYRYRLQSPTQGTVTAVHVSPGTHVQADQVLFSITDASTVWLQAKVPVSWQHAVGNPTDATFTVQGIDSSFRVSEMGGALLSKNRPVDANSRTLTLTYLLNNHNQYMSPGMFSTVNLHTNTQRNTLAIPKSSLLEEEGTFNVYVHVSGESFEKRRVIIGLRDTDWVEILDGLQPGEYVVTTNPYQVQLASLSNEAPAHGHAH